MCVRTAGGSGRLIQLGHERLPRYGSCSDMNRIITDFEKDDDNHWRAILDCGHRQHVRHDPPLTTREWVMTEEGRGSRIGFELNCKRCDEENEAAPLND